MNTVFELGGKNPYKNAPTESLITLEQKQTNTALFVLTYGLERKANLTYDKACQYLGQAILHHLCCEGIATNEGL